MEGELLAIEFLKGGSIAHKPLTATAVCVDDVKIKRRRDKS